MGEERNLNSCHSMREKQAEGESLGGRRKAKMLFGDFWDKLPSKGGCTQHMLCSVTQSWEPFWDCKPTSYACAYNMPALLHLHLLRGSLPLCHLTKTHKHNATSHLCQITISFEISPHLPDRSFCFNLDLMHRTKTLRHFSWLKGSCSLGRSSYGFKSKPTVLWQ